MADSGLFLFVSHVAENRTSALEIVDELERRGTRCWIAPRDVRPGKPFDDEIADAIEASRAMLLIFSDLCNDSDYIRREVTVAGESRKTIIPFRIENAQPRRGLRVRLSDLHWIDGFVSRERAIDEVMKTFAPLGNGFPRGESAHVLRDDRQPRIEPVQAEPKPADVMTQDPPIIAVTTDAAAGEETRPPIKPSAEATPSAAGSGETAPSAAPTIAPSQGNPLRHYVAACLMINAAFALIVFGSLVYANPPLQTERLMVLTILFTVILVFLVLVGTGIGTVKSQKWARIVGFIMSLIAMCIAAFIAFSARIFYFQHDQFKFAIFLLAYSCITAIALAASAAFYIWGWRSVAWPRWIGNVPRNTVFFGVFGLLFIALTLTGYVLLATDTNALGSLSSHNFDYISWLIALIVIDSLMLTYCIRQFRAERRKSTLNDAVSEVQTP